MGTLDHGRKKVVGPKLEIELNILYCSQYYFPYQKGTICDPIELPWISDTLRSIPGVD